MVPRSEKEITAAFEAEWTAAVADADVDEAKLRYWLTSGTTPRHAESIPTWLWPPGFRIDEDSALAGNQRAEAETAIDLYRVEFHLDFPAPPNLDADGTRALIGGLLRHEMEHVKQHEACGTPPIELYHLARHAINLEQGKVRFEVLGQAPVELDANAAAAGYLRTHHPGEVEAIAATEQHGNLVRSPDLPGPYENLTKRMVEFLFGFREAFSKYLWGAPIEDFLADQVADEAARAWTECEARIR